MAPLPAYLQNRKSKPITDVLAANLGTASPPYISIRGNRFTLIDAVGAEEPMTEVDDKTGLPYIDVCIAEVLVDDLPRPHARSIRQGVRPVDTPRWKIQELFDELRTLFCKNYFFG